MTEELNEETEIGRAKELYRIAGILKLEKTQEQLVKAAGYVMLGVNDAVDLTFFLNGIEPGINSKAEEAIAAAKQTLDDFCEAI